MVEVSNWRASANCAGLDTELFFPDRGGVENVIKKICKNCSVKVECAEFAISIPEIMGYWGGTNERQRQKIRKSRQKIAS